MRTRYPALARITLLLVGVVPFCVMGGALTPASATTFPYTIEDLGALPGETGCLPWAINARGQVAGWSGNRAFLFTEGIGIVELAGPPGYTNTLARGINDAGVVVGEGWTPNVLPYHALRWSDGEATDLGALGTSSRAWDISPRGEAVGETPVDDLGSDAFLHTDGSGMSLLAPANFSSHAYDINESGQVAGSMTAYNTYHAFRFAPGAGVQDLGVAPNFAHSYGAAINVSGQVAGSVTSATGNSQKVFRHTEGEGMVVLGGAGEENWVWGMNARGDFVGRGLPTPTGIRRAFLYTDENGLQDLEGLVDMTLGWRLLYATDINDAGQIVGFGLYNPTGEWRGFRLTPTTPVGPLAALSLSPVRVEGSVLVEGWVTLTQPAPPGGAFVTLSSGDPQIVTLPASVSIAEGERHGRFTVTTMSVTSVTLVEVTAEYGGSLRMRTLEVTPLTTTGVEDMFAPTTVLRVHGLAPNPASTTAHLRYELTQPAYVGLRIYDARGRLVRTLVDSWHGPGEHRATWNRRDQADQEVASGVYFVRVEAAGIRYHGRLVLTR